jgi:hypothetical protein
MLMSSVLKYATCAFSSLEKSKAIYTINLIREYMKATCRTMFCLHQLPYSPWSDPIACKKEYKGVDSAKYHYYLDTAMIYTEDMSIFFPACISLAGAAMSPFDSVSPVRVQQGPQTLASAIWALFGRSLVQEQKDDLQGQMVFEELMDLSSWMDGHQWKWAIGVRAKPSFPTQKSPIERQVIWLIGKQCQKHHFGQHERVPQVLHCQSENCICLIPCLCMEYQQSSFVVMSITKHLEDILECGHKNT